MNEMKMQIHLYFLFLIYLLSHIDMRKASNGDIFHRHPSVSNQRIRFHAFVASHFESISEENKTLLWSSTDRNREYTYIDLCIWKGSTYLSI